MLHYAKGRPSTLLFALMFVVLTGCGVASPVSEATATCDPVLGNSSEPILDPAQPPGEQIIGVYLIDAFIEPYIVGFAPDGNFYFPEITMWPDLNLETQTPYAISSDGNMEIEGLGEFEYEIEPGDIQPVLRLHRTSQGSPTPLDDLELVRVMDVFFPQFDWESGSPIDTCELVGLWEGQMDGMPDFVHLYFDDEGLLTDEGVEAAYLLDGHTVFVFDPERAGAWKLFIFDPIEENDFSVRIFFADRSRFSDGMTHIGYADYRIRKMENAYEIDADQIPGVYIREDAGESSQPWLIVDNDTISNGGNMYISEFLPPNALLLFNSDESRLAGSNSADLRFFLIDGQIKYLDLTSASWLGLISGDWFVKQTYEFEIDLENQIVGAWRILESEVSGFEIGFTFQTDGLLSLIGGRTLPFDVVNNEFVVIDQSAISEITQKVFYLVAVDGDRLTLMDSYGNSMIIERMVE